MKYAHIGEIINNIERSGLLVGNNAEWAKEAIYAAPTISVSDYVPDARIQQLIKQCEKQLDYYRSLGSISKVECYCDFINMLKTLAIDEEE